MVHLTKIMRMGGPPKAYFKNYRIMPGLGKELLDKNAHYYTLLPMHFATGVGIALCVGYLIRWTLKSPDVVINTVTNQFPWLNKPENHQYKFFSFDFDYKTLKPHPHCPPGFHNRDLPPIKEED